MRRQALPGLFFPPSYFDDTSSSSYSPSRNFRTWYRPAYYKWMTCFGRPKVAECPLHSVHVSQSWNTCLYLALYKWTRCHVDWSVCPHLRAVFLLAHFGCLRPSFHVGCCLSNIYANPDPTCDKRGRGVPLQPQFRSYPICLFCDHCYISWLHSWFLWSIEVLWVEQRYYSLGIEAHPKGASLIVAQTPMWNRAPIITALKRFPIELLRSFIYRSNGYRPWDRNDGLSALTTQCHHACEIIISWITIHLGCVYVPNKFFERADMMCHVQKRQLNGPFEALIFSTL